MSCTRRAPSGEIALAITVLNDHDKRVKTAFLGVALAVLPAPGGWAHPHPGHPLQPLAAAAASATPAAPPVTDRKTAGQGGFQFRYLAAASRLPDEAQARLNLAHGGFAVDPKTGEVFFGLKGVGVIWMNNHLTEKRVLPVKNPTLLEGNFHNTTLLFSSDGRRFLALPDNEKGRVLILTDAGELTATLNAPRAANEYYAGGGNFNPTDTEYAGNRLYVADGYSPGNYVTTADPWLVKWLPLVFGGKARAKETGLFGTAHGLTLNPAIGQLAIADRANSRIQTFDLEGRFLASTTLPDGCLPCDVDFHDGHVLVGCLQGPKGKTPAPFYVLDAEGNVRCEVTPKADFGLDRYTHIHNATWKVVRGPDGKADQVWVLTTAWNPGDFAVFEWVR